MVSKMLLESQCTDLGHCLPFILTCTTPDPAVHLQFLVDLDKRINAENAKEAHVLLLATIAHAKLLFGDLEGTKTDLNAAEDILNELSGVDTGVNAAFYGVFAAYCKVRELPRPPHAEYY
jgi:26S proteasome regulatory subunit N9